MNRTSLVAVGIVGGSLTLIVSNYDPDLTMLLATVLLLAFGIVTPAQGTALRLSQQHLALQALHALPSVLQVPVLRVRFPKCTLSVPASAIMIITVAIASIW